MTSVGDAPGMDAAIRAVVRTGLNNGCEIFDIRNGYADLIAGTYVRLGRQIWAASFSARAPEFKTERGRLKALRALCQLEIEGLSSGQWVADGRAYASQLRFPVVGVAAAIDKNLAEVGDRARVITLESTSRSILLCGLIAYSQQPKRPALQRRRCRSTSLFCRN